MRKLIYISLLAIAGCTTQLTAPEQPVGVPPTELSGYFWHDSAASYSYKSSAGGHTLRVNADGTIVDDNEITGVKTTFAVTKAHGGYSIGGFSHSDLFALDSSIQFVSDTNTLPGPQTETIRSIASASLGFGATLKLYAVSDSVLYDVDPNLTLDELGRFPSGYTLAEDAQNTYLFAYRPGGDSILWTSDGKHWFISLTSSGVTAFTSVSSNFNGDICWYACGQNVYRMTALGSMALINSLPGTVTAMTSETTNEVIAGLSNGDIYDVSRSGTLHLRQNVSGKLDGIAYVTSGFSNATLVGTSNGVFSVPSSGAAMIIDGDPVSAIYSTGSSLFAGVTNSVFHYNPNGTLYDTYSNPIGGIVTQFAHPTSAIPSPSYGIYALSGTTIYRRDSDAAGSRWTPANQVISSQVHPQPGSLTLLADTLHWLAGYALNTSNGQSRSYSYQASGSGPYVQVALDGVSYSNVYMVRYTAYSNGVADSMDMPEYLIYFQLGTGPIRIERTENGNTIVTKLVQ